MNRHVILAVAALTLIAGLTVTVRYDLAILAWRQGNSRLNAGDFNGAQAAFRRAGGTRGETAFNQGVALYRLGEFRKAGELFSAAATAPALGAAAYYNMGNCAFREGERLAAKEPLKAANLFREALAAYEKTLALSPAAADVRHNIGMVRARLDSQENGQGRKVKDRPPAPGTTASGANAPKAADGKAPQDAKLSANRQPGAGKQTTGARSSDGAPGTAGPRKRDQLSRDEAERLLSEVRGRERPSGSVSVNDKGRLLRRPDKDW